MRETTLCYIEKEHQYLMLYRNKKKQDPNAGKWIGVGGRLEPGETPEECVVREVFEETGLTLTEYEKRGEILFYSDRWENEIMHLYTATGFVGELAGECDEGELQWIPLEKLSELPLWEGDRVFLQELSKGARDFQIALYYRGDNLVTIRHLEKDGEELTEKPVLRKEKVMPLYESKFVSLYDLRYEPDRHYYNASRRTAGNLIALKDDAEFRLLVPDAVSCVVILKRKDQEPLLLATREFRFPTGQFLLGIPAGLIDPEDLKDPVPAFTAAKRELEEECGIAVGEKDFVEMVNPCLFSSPGMTDECNAVVKIVLCREDMPELTSEGAVGGECFAGYRMLTPEDARRILRNGRDDEGLYYSVYTWIALNCFLEECTKKDER